MKKIFTTQIFLLCSLLTFSQLKVLENGNVGIGTSQPLSKLSIGGAGSSQHYVNIDAPNVLRAIQISRTGNPGYSSSNNWIRTLNINNEIQNTFFNVAAQISTFFSTPRNSGRAFGVIGTAGNSTSGYNYGIVGAISGSQNGTGIYGAETSNNLSPYIPGRFAGYFAGNVGITGTLTLAGSTVNSDLRYKQNIVELGENGTSIKSASSANVLSNVLKMSPVQYNLKQRYIESVGDSTTVKQGLFNEESDLFQKKHYGLIAQDLQKIYPDLVYEDSEGYLSVDYIGIIPLLIQSVKDLKTQVDELKEVALAQTKDTSPEGSLLKSESAILYQNTPNPFSQTTQIKYFLPSSVSTAYLCIYNMQGKQLKQIEIAARGTGQETISGSELPAGIYLYTLLADGKDTGVKKMILTD